MPSWDEAEFDAFVGARMGALVRFAYALTGDLGHAEDLVQTALIRVYRRSRRMRPDDPERYVRRAIVNEPVPVPPAPGGRVAGRDAAGVRLGWADLRLVEPGPADPDWWVSIRVAPVDRAALAAYTRANAGRRIAYVADGRVIAGAPDLATERSGSVEIAVAGRASAEALVARPGP